MSATTTREIGADATPHASAPHDRVTRALHWLTAGLVVLLFCLYLAWGELPRGTPARHLMQSLHVSLGLTLTAVLIARIVWRSTPHASRTVHEGLQGLAAQAIHLLLYALLILQVILGWTFRWQQGEPLSFFGLFSIPSPLARIEGAAHMLGTLHYWTAYAILALAFGHAAAALVHHHIVRDDVLRRMMGTMRGRSAE